MEIGKSIASDIKGEGELRLADTIRALAIKIDFTLKNICDENHISLLKQEITYSRNNSGKLLLIIRKTIRLLGRSLRRRNINSGCPSLLFVFSLVGTDL